MNMNPLAALELQKVSDGLNLTETKIIGHGAYGVVIKGKSTTLEDTDTFVAIKLIQDTEGEGISQDVLREIDALKRLQNNINIIHFVQAKYGNNFTAIYTELMDVDLNYYMYEHRHNWFNPQQIQNFAKQLLNGLNFIHEKGIIHRDLKPSNILVCKQSKILKYCDFGLSRLVNYPMGPPYSSEVCTIWHRPIEIVLGKADYDSKIDIWSLGTIVFELSSKGKILFRSQEHMVKIPQTDLDKIRLLHKILKVVGTQNENNWPGVTSLPLYKKYIVTKIIFWAELESDLPYYAVVVYCFVLVRFLYCFIIILLFIINHIALWNLAL